MAELPKGVEPMRNFNIKLSEDIRDWLHLEARRKGINLSAAARDQLRLAYKYREAIEAAEKAPAVFVRDHRRQA